MLYFLRRTQVEGIFRTLALARLPKLGARTSKLHFDYASPLGGWIVTRRPAHRQLGTTFSWTVRKLSELRRVDPRLEVVEDSNVFLQAMGPGARQIDALYRLVTNGSGFGGCARLSRTHSG